MDEVLHANAAELAQGALDQVVGGDGGAVASNLSRKIESEVVWPFFQSCYTFDGWNVSNFFRTLHQCESGQCRI